MNKKYNFTNKDLLLVIIFAITVLICSYFISWHNTYEEHNINKSIISENISEVSSEELNSYMIENPNTFIYFGMPEDDKTKTFEKEFRGTINRYYLKDKVVYVNSNNVNLNLFKENISAPVIIYFEDGKLLDYISYDNNQMINKTIIKFFRLYGDL